MRVTVTAKVEAVTPKGDEGLLGRVPQALSRLSPASSRWDMESRPGAL